MRVSVITYLPSPYQVELFNALAASGEIQLSVVYLRQVSGTPIARNWKGAALRHDHVALDDQAVSLAEAHRLICSADLVVFHYYQHPAISGWMRSRVETGAPWCFWGERPGYKWAALGRLYRRWKLAPLHHSKAAVWGMGRLAVRQYQSEFGDRRAYFNVPYFSDLERYAAAGRDRPMKANERHFLYSGALIKRKGVDLLAEAFIAAAAEFPAIRLTVIGTGGLEESMKHRLKPLGSRVAFCGFQSWEDLPARYAAADVLVAPSRHDGWALVVPEAMAAGLPVIGTDATGAAIEFIQNRVNGWLVEAGREDALLQAMRAASALSTGELQRCSAAARLSVADHQLGDGVRRFLEAARGSVKLFQN